MARKAHLEATIGLNTRVFRRGISRVMWMTRDMAGKLKRVLRIPFVVVPRGISKAIRLVRTAIVRGLFFGGTVGFALGKTLQKSFNFERIRVQFGILLQDMKAGKERFDEIKEMSAVTPFQIEDLAMASKQLEIMGFHGRENIKMLNLVGDAAAAMNPDLLQQVAFWMGRLNVEAKNNAVGRSTLRLLQLGVISAEAKIRMEKLANSGAEVGDVLAVAEAELMRFSGGMDLLSRTGWGLFSTMKDNWTITLATFGNAIAENAKGAMVELINTMRELRTNGTLDRWAEKVNTAISSVAGTIKAAIGGDASARTLLVDTAFLTGKLIGNAIHLGIIKAMEAVPKTIFTAISNSLKRNYNNMVDLAGGSDLLKFEVPDWPFAKGTKKEIDDIRRRWKEFELELESKPVGSLPGAPQPPSPTTLEDPTQKGMVSSLRKIGARDLSSAADRGAKTDEKILDINRRQLNEQIWLRENMLYGFAELAREINKGLGQNNGGKF